MLTLIFRVTCQLDEGRLENDNWLMTICKRLFDSINSTEAYGYRQFAIWQAANTQMANLTLLTAKLPEPVVFVANGISYDIASGILWCFSLSFHVIHQHTCFYSINARFMCMIAHSSNNTVVGYVNLSSTKTFIFARPVMNRFLFVLFNTYTNESSSTNFYYAEKELYSHN